MRLPVLLLAAALVVASCAHPPAVPADPAPGPPPPTPAPAPRAAAAVPADPGPDRCGTDLVRLLGEELALRPEAGPEDLYRLLHEAILGPAGALADPALARESLDRELSAAGPPRPEERIVEDLDERLGTVRVNLRRWKFIRATADELWPLLERSARELGEGDRERLAACLARAAPVLEALGRDAGAFRAFAVARGEEGFPAVPPGPAYREAHRPSYRVVLRRFLPPWVTAPPPEAG